jgi:hypothetical protein
MAEVISKFSRICSMCKRGVERGGAGRWGSHGKEEGVGYLQQHRGICLQEGFQRPRHVQDKAVGVEVQRVLGAGHLLVLHGAMPANTRTNTTTDDTDSEGTPHAFGKYCSIDEFMTCHNIYVFLARVTWAHLDTKKSAADLADSILRVKM